MSKNIKTDDLDPHQERLLREMISKEMLGKIQRRIDNEDSNVMKTMRSLMDEQKQKKSKIENKLKSIIKDKESEKRKDDE